MPQGRGRRVPTPGGWRANGPRARPGDVIRRGARRLPHGQWPGSEFAFPAAGKIKVKDEELDATFKEASGPIDFTVFLNARGFLWAGTDPEETVLSALKMLDPDGKGSANKD
ncbi:myosin light chain 5 [Bos indicus x Bos taurus]|uniref:myosin light chain 5 n=1 Tax=Bos indicus x Bos taurus TaxID=30522 RepID=UPI000F7D3EC1|nr:myosin light chain 5 [Bos indicus x Bos taurus]